jgi:hypothetical protein
MQKRIGFIGQGWIGKHYADDFEARGFEVTRYAMEEPHNGNKEKIKECDIVFIAVPTPTTPRGFDDSIVREVLKNIGEGKTAIIKSTILPGTTHNFQKEYPDIFVMHSPEFLTEATAAYDAAHPNRNIIGIPEDSELFRQKAQEVLDALPPAKFSLICRSSEAELIKYGGNCYLFFKLVYINMLYDLAAKLGCRWEIIRDVMAADPRIGSSHMNPVHKSGESGGEAGENKKFNDFAAFTELYEKIVGDESGVKALKGLEEKNIDLLVKSKKDPDLLAGVFGETVLKK